MILLIFFEQSFKSLDLCMTKKSLAETHPEIAKQWHPIYNKDLTPFDVTPGSGKIVWWKCPKGDDHEWQAKIQNRSRRGDGCVHCSNSGTSKQEIRIFCE